MIEELVAESLAALSSVTEAVAPLVALFLAFQILWLRLPWKQVLEVLVGTAIASAGLFLFLLGMEIGFLPFGRAIGTAFGAADRPVLFVVVGAILGFLTAWGEPAVRVLADQIEEATNGSIRKPLVLAATCVGVAACVGLGVVRILLGIPLLYILAPGYLLVLLLMWRCDSEFVAIAVDAGGVATGPLANSFLLALAMGASVAMGDQDPITHGLGLVALISVAPIISVMTLGLLLRGPRRGIERGAGSNETRE